MKDVNEIMLNQHMSKVQSGEEKYEEMIDELNETIGSEYFELKERFNSLVNIYGFDYSFEDYINKWRPLMQTWLQPYSGKYLPSLFKKGLLPSVFGKKKKLLITNLVRCESHRDILIPSIEKKE